MQHLAVTEAIPRTRLLNSVTAWFAKDESPKKPLIVLGEEGDGKTWLVADWLYRKLDTTEFPLVLFLPSSFVTDTDVMKLLSSALARNSPHFSADHWWRRIQRWTDPEGSNTPPMLLVLDGVNEKFASIGSLHRFLQVLVGMICLS